MKHLLLVLAFAGCSFDSTYEPPHDATPQQDAAVVATDAARPDSSITETKGCDMGNLPFSRTKTYGAHDPVDSAILDELQDNVIAAARKPFWRSFFPVIACKDAIAGGWRQTANTTFPGIEALIVASGVGLSPVYEEGDTMVAGTIDILGDGTSTGTVSISMSAGPGNTSAVNQSLTNMTALSGWHRYALTGPNPGTGPFVPFVIPVGSAIWMDVQTNVLTTSFIVGQIRLQFQRTP